MVTNTSRYKKRLAENITILGVFSALIILAFVNLGQVWSLIAVACLFVILIHNMEYRKKYDEMGQPLGLVSVHAQTLDNIPTPMFIVSDTSLCTYANQKAIELFGPKIIGDTISNHISNQHISNAVTQVIHGEDPSENDLRFKTHDDQNYDVSILEIPEENGFENGRVVVFFYDVTQLLKTEKMRVDFVANASHELRTPLSSILGFIETLQGPAKDDKEAGERFLGIMKTEAERMTRLIDDLLSLSRIELERHQAPQDKINVKTLLSNVVRTLTEKAAKRGITFKLELEADLKSLRADNDQLTQVLVNLVSNAAKYANRDTQVTIGACRAKRGQIRIYISDQGPGIAAEHLPRLTERFYRVDTARSRKMGGTGLGLAIVKHILLRHESKLNIKSQTDANNEIGTGTGTTFSFKIKTYNNHSSKDDSGLNNG